MNRDLRCFCGDSECPSCGTAQGTYSGPSDPGPGVAEVEEFQRMANRPPDAVLDPTDVATLAWQQLEEMERRIRAEMARRDKIEDDLLNLVALRQNNESKRAATLDWFADRLLRAREREQAQRSMVNRLIWYGGPILAGFTALLAMTNVWRLFP